MATPLVYRGVLYVVTYNGVLTAYDAKTGEKHFTQRLADGTSAFTASPVAADGKVYFASEDGRVFVLKAEPHLRARSPPTTWARARSPRRRFPKGSMFWRTQGHWSSRLRRLKSQLAGPGASTQSSNANSEPFGGTAGVGSCLELGSPRCLASLEVGS